MVRSGHAHGRVSNRKGWTQRVLSLFMTLVMLFSLLPAVHVTAEAAEAAESGPSIEVGRQDATGPGWTWSNGTLALNGVYAPGGIKFNDSSPKDVTIVVSGYNQVGFVSTVKAGLTIKGTGMLDVEKNIEAGTAVWNYAGRLTVESGYIKAHGMYAASTQSSNENNDDYYDGLLTVKGGYVELNDSIGAVNLCGCYEQTGGYVRAERVYMRGGKISGGYLKTTYALGSPDGVRDGTTFTISGGVVNIGTHLLTSSGAPIKFSITGGVTVFGGAADRVSEANVTVGGSLKKMNETGKTVTALSDAKIIATNYVDASKLAGDSTVSLADGAYVAGDVNTSGTVSVGGDVYVAGSVKGGSVTGGKSSILAVEAKNGTAVETTSGGLSGNLVAASSANGAGVKLAGAVEKPSYGWNTSISTVVARGNGSDAAFTGGISANGTVIAANTGSGAGAQVGKFEMGNDTWATSAQITGYSANGEGVVFTEGFETNYGSITGAGRTCGVNFAPVSGDVRLRLASNSAGPFCAYAGSGAAVKKTDNVSFYSNYDCPVIYAAGIGETRHEGTFADALTANAGFVRVGNHAKICAVGDGAAQTVAAWNTDTVKNEYFGGYGGADVTFAGFFYDVDYKKPAAADAKDLAADNTYYAKWTVTDSGKTVYPFSITFDSNWYKTLNEYGISWDRQTNTLTLDGAYIIGNYGGVTLPAGSTVVVKGNSGIRNLSYYGIALASSGAGNVTVKAAAKETKLALSSWNGKAMQLGNGGLVMYRGTVDLWSGLKSGQDPAYFGDAVTRANSGVTMDIQGAGQAGDALEAVTHSTKDRYYKCNTLANTAKYLTLSADCVSHFDDRFGGVVDETNYKQYTAESTPNEYANSQGYTFAGWYTCIDGVINYINNGTKLEGDAVEGVQYYAKWTRNGNTVRTEVFDLKSTASDYVSEQGWEWIPNSYYEDGNALLKLENTTMDARGQRIANLMIEKNITIEIQGDNRLILRADGESGSVSGISTNDLIVKGNGSLTILIAGCADAASSYALRSTYVFSIKDGAQVTAVTEAARGESYGVRMINSEYSKGKITMANGTSLTAQGGTQAINTGRIAAEGATAYAGESADTAAKRGSVSSALSADYKYARISFLPVITVGAPEGDAAYGTAKSWELGVTVDRAPGEAMHVEWQNGGNWTADAPNGLSAVLSAPEALSGTLTVNAGASAAVGSYTLRVKSGESISNTVTVKVVKAAVTIDGVSLNGKTYDGTPLAVSGTPAVKSAGGTVLDNVDVTAKWERKNSDGSFTEVRPDETKHAGEYRYVLAVDTADCAGSLTLEATVAQRALTVRAPMLRAYVGDAAPALGEPAVEGTLSGGDTVGQAASMQYETTPDMNAAGETKILIGGMAILDAQGIAVTDDYNITYVPGKLTVAEHAVFDDRFGGSVDETNYASYTTASSAYASAQGYEFAGWYTDIDGAGAKLTGEAADGARYYAKWTRGGKTVRTQALDHLFAGSEDTAGVANAEQGWSWNGSVLTLDGATFDVKGENALKYNGSDALCLALVGDNRLIASGIDGGTVEVLRADNGLSVEYGGALSVSVRADGTNPSISTAISTFNMVVQGGAQITAVSGGATTCSFGVKAGGSILLEDGSALSAKSGAAHEECAVKADSMLKVETGCILTAEGAGKALSGALIVGDYAVILGGEDAANATEKDTGSLADCKYVHVGYPAMAILSRQSGSLTYGSAEAMVYGLRLTGFTDAGEPAVVWYDENGAETAAPAGLRTELASAGGSAYTLRVYAVNGAAKADAGSYRLGVRVPDSGARVDSNIVDLTVAKAVRGNVTLAEYAVRDNSRVQTEQSYSVDITSALVEGWRVSAQSADNREFLSDGVISADGEGRVTLNFMAQPMDEGTRGTITVTVESGNYETYSIILPVTAAAKSGVAIDLSGLTVAGAGKAYDGTAVSRSGGASAAEIGADGFDYQWFEVYSAGDDTYVIERDTAPVKPGSYRLAASVKSDNPDYTGSGFLSFVIEKAGLVIRAADRAVKVGAAAPDLTNPVRGTDYSVSGLVDGDALSLTMAYYKDGAPVTPDTSAAGSYDIVVCAVSADTALYTVQTVSGTLTVRANDSTPGGGGGGRGGSAATYPVGTPAQSTGGSVTSVKNASAGDTVTITVTPESGYVIGSVTVRDSKGNALAVKALGGGKYSFTMPAGAVTVEASFTKSAPDFTDVKAGKWYTDAIAWAVGQGITNGVGNGLFAPDEGCTRGQIVTFLWRAAGSPEPKELSGFADVGASKFYAKAVAWAVENGITTGTAAESFEPNAVCTRAQAVTFLCRALGAAAEGGAGFTDVKTGKWYTDAIAWAVGQGITNGVGNGLFAPDEGCTRAQIVTFLYRAYQGK